MQPFQIPNAEPRTPNPESRTPNPEPRIPYLNTPQIIRKNFQKKLLTKQ
ncbi:MAG: hypothetical protein FWD58_00805 [Firmicutes bacterium]|nr:hypothetical protein [Bacillota bacterium]